MNETGPDDTAAQPRRAADARPAERSNGETATTRIKPAKPLGRKAYGSIPHLPGSRLGPGDHSVHPGQERTCLSRARDKHDRIIVTEKLDGSNVAVGKIGGALHALGRAGYPADTSPHVQHQYFAHWVYQNRARFDAILLEGDCVHGEWLAQAHGTLYELPHEPFVVFDFTRNGKRLLWDDAASLARAASFTTPRILSDGAPLSIEQALIEISYSGHGAIEAVEGAVWRVERKGAFDFLAKYVRADKRDGKYLPEINGGSAVWHWQPEAVEVSLATESHESGSIQTVTAEDAHPVPAQTKSPSPMGTDDGGEPTKAKERDDG